MRRSLIPILVLAGACASGSDVDQGSATTGGQEGGGGSGTGDDCGFCTMPPAPTCEGECASAVYDPNGTCADGGCSYASHVEDCAFGCDPSSGACRSDPAQACSDVMCGEKSACGGTCDMATGCCFKEQYDKSTGFAYNGATVCCDGTDPRLGYADCGDGDDHWAVESSTNCAVAYEGDDNYGGPCAQVTCERIVCASGAGGQGGSGGHPSPE